MAISRNTHRHEAKRQNREYDRTRKYSSGGIWYMRIKVGTRPIRFHPFRPEKPIIDPYTGSEFYWRRRRSHFVSSLNGGKGGYLECGGFPGENTPGCVLDAYLSPQEFDLDIEADPDLSRLDCDMRMSYVIPGFVEEWFHLVQKPTKKDKNKTYTDRELCRGAKNCPLCARGAPRVFGRRGYLEFSKYAWDTQVEPMYEKIEKYCRCGGLIYVPEYVCPECATVVIDVANSCPACERQGLEANNIEIDAEKQEARCLTCDSQWSLLESEDPDLAEAVGMKHTCPGCGHEDYPSANLICTEENCEVDPYDLFDVQFKIKKEDDKQNSSVVITDWDIREVNPRLFDVKCQGDVEGASAEAIKAAETAVERNQTHIDLEKAFPIESTAAQAKTLDRPDPFSEADQSIAAQNYAANYGDDGYDDEYSE